MVRCVVVKTIKMPKEFGAEILNVEKTLKYISNSLKKKKIVIPFVRG